MNDWWLYSFSIESPYDAVPEQSHGRAIAVAWIGIAFVAYAACQVLARRRAWQIAARSWATGPLAALAMIASWLLSMAFFTSRIWDPHAATGSTVQWVLAGPISSGWHRFANHTLLSIGAFGAVLPEDWFSGGSYHRPPDYIFIGLLADVSLLLLVVTVLVIIVTRLTPYVLRHRKPAKIH